MSNYRVIAVDAMGGDFGPKVILPAAIMALKKNKDLQVILVGQESVLKRYLKKLKPNFGERLLMQNASEVVEMDELPSQALRGKKDSSMRVSINLVKEGKAQACVSAGNTGALMATARFVLKTLPGIDRPAIMYAFPNRNGLTHMLDLGANVDCSAEHLLQFAIMGSVLTEAVFDMPEPKVGLLNVGTEEIKGNEQVKEAAQLISESKALNYIGYVEGDDIMLGDVDVVVCDGFVGNVALKSMEGLAKMTKSFMMQAIKHNLFTRVCAVFAYPVLKLFKEFVNTERYNGASLVGLNGIVVKSHGGAKVVGLYHAIEEALHEVEKDVPQKICQKLQLILDK